MFYLRKEIYKTVKENMKNKIALITCSNSCIDYIDHDYDIRTFRSSLHINDEDYLDFIDITVDEFYQKLEDDRSLLPKTSYFPIGGMIQMYKELVNEGYTKAIVITISKKLSGTYSSAKTAANSVDNLDITVFDSETFAFPQAKMALTAAKMINENKDIDSIIHELEFIRDNNKVYLAVYTLNYLIKNGRLSNASGFIGNTIKIKPVISVIDGKIEIVDKIRTFKKATDKIITRYLEETEELDVEPFIIHANNPEMRDYIIEKLKENDTSLKKVSSLPLSPVIGSHSGPKTIGLGYCIKNPKQITQLA